MIPSTTDSIAAAIWATLYVLVIAGEMGRRIHAGTSIEGLFRGGLREAQTLRWLLQSACAIAALATLMECTSALASGSLRGRTLVDWGVPAWAGCIALMVAAAAVALALVGWVERCRVRGTTVDLSGLELTRGIERDENENGTPASDLEKAREGLPQWDEWRALGFAGMGLLVFAVALQLSSDLPASGFHTIDKIVRFVALGAPPAALRAALFPATVCLGVLTFDRATPLTLSNSRRRALQFGLLVLIALCAAALAVDSAIGDLSPCATGFAMLGIGLVGISIREEFDAKLAKARQKIRQLREAIAVGFPDCGQELESVARAGSIRRLKLDYVRARIEAGLEHLEARSRLVPRFLGGLMKITEVATTPVAAMGLRFLIVQRRIVLERPTATRETLRHPSVDVWNEEMFPIVSPDEYRAADDQRIILPAPYDVIKECGRCGGSGWVWGEESYSENEPWVDGDGNTEWRWVSKTRSVREICRNCSGTGALRYRQVVITGWKVCEPTLQSSTAAPSLDMFDGTSELDALRCPLIEHFKPATDTKSGYRLQGVGDTCFRSAMARARQLSARDAGLVAGQYAGRVYRSELVVSLTQAIRIKYTGLPGGTAWFVGASPKSHFRRLPPAWSALFASALLPPLAAYGLIEGCAVAQTLLGFLMRK